LRIWIKVYIFRITYNFYIFKFEALLRSPNATISPKKPHMSQSAELAHEKMTLLHYPKTRHIIITFYIFSPKRADIPIATDRNPNRVESRFFRQD